MSLQSSLADDLAERTENEKIHLTAAKEENEKLKEVLQSEINEYKVVRAQTTHCIIVATLCNAQEQSRQYAITIVAFEQKVLDLVAKNGNCTSNGIPCGKSITQASQTSKQFV